MLIMSGTKNYNYSNSVYTKLKKKTVQMMFSKDIKCRKFKDFMNAYCSTQTQRATELPLCNDYDEHM